MQYHGKISSNDAYNVLINHPTGSFLVLSGFEISMVFFTRSCRCVRLRVLECFVYRGSSRQLLLFTPCVRKKARTRLNQCDFFESLIVGSAWHLDTVGENRDWDSIKAILDDYKKTMSIPVMRK